MQENMFRMWIYEKVAFIVVFLYYKQNQLIFLCNTMVWQKGQSGNPNGRPKYTPISDAYRLFSDRKIKVEVENLEHEGKKYQVFKTPDLGEYFSELLDEKGRLTVAQLAALQNYVQASKGNLDSVKEITDRLEGKPKQAVVGGDEDDAPIQHAITVKYVE